VRIRHAKEEGIRLRPWVVSVAGAHRRFVSHILLRTERTEKRLDACCPVVAVIRPVASGAIRPSRLYLFAPSSTFRSSTCRVTSINASIFTCSFLRRSLAHRRLVHFAIVRPETAADRRRRLRWQFLLQIQPFGRTERVRK
jgi:hypothetical protein